MPRMKSIAEHPFGNRKMQVGDEFDADDREARQLEALKWAERVAQPVNHSRQRTYRRRDMTAEQ